MELAGIVEVDYRMLVFENFDFFLAALDSQNRCSFLAENLRPSAIEKFVFSSGGNKGDQPCIQNSNIFTRLGFHPVSVTANKTNELETFVEKYCLKHQTDHINLLMDYSCMPKNWYSRIIYGITGIDDKPKTISVFLSYTPETCKQFQPFQGIEYTGPILEEKDSLRNSVKRPVAMVAGFDHNYQSMLGLIKKVNPRRLIAFIPDCPDNSDYADSVIRLNKTVLGKLTETDIIRYNIKDPEEIDSMLTSQCMKLRLDSEVMIVPQGPKVFSMVSLLLSLRYPDIKLWEIVGKSRKRNQPEGDLHAIPVVVKVNFCEDLDY